MKFGELLGNVNSIEGLQGNNLLSRQKNSTNTDESFGDILNKSLSQVNQSQLDGYKAMEEIATGKVENLQQAIQKIEEAELSLKLALEVKNKALNAYKEISKIQV